MNKLEQQVIALSGLFQACSLVDEIARTGRCEQDALETSLSSLFVTNPESTLSVFGSIAKLETGLRQLVELFGESKPESHMHSVRYALAILHLESKLRKTPAMLDEIGSRLERASSQAAHFNLLHENVIASIAAIYADTISTFKLRVQVSGNPNFLQVEQHAAKIRALLLSAIRSATLWHQLGGHRWQLLFKRKAFAKTASQLLATVQAN